MVVLNFSICSFNVLCMSKQCPDKTMISCIILGGQRKKGRPKKTWSQTFQFGLASINTEWKDVEMVATDQTLWKTFVAQCACHRM